MTHTVTLTSDEVAGLVKAHLEEKGYTVKTVSVRIATKTTSDPTDFTSLFAPARHTLDTLKYEVEVEK